MSTKEKMSVTEQRIKARINEFNDITRDIDWQKSSFLTYCANITKDEGRDSNKESQNNILHNAEEAIVDTILDGYFALFLVFYKKVRENLRTHYTETLDINESDVKLGMQEALGKLVNEWERVYAIITALRARRANEESRRLLDQMAPFVEVAMNDVGLSYKDFPVILQFGQSYSLRFSKYSDKFAALSIPLWVLKSPWEWTILWHELAGERVRQEKVDAPGFSASQFDMILQTLIKDKNPVDAVMENGWSVDWFEELLEDSFSIINFPIHFLIVFQLLLERYPDGGKGLRHPPRSFRLATAMFLHLQMKMKSMSTEPPIIDEWPAWKKWDEIKDETDFERFKSFDPYNLLSNALDVKVAWLTAQKILKWHKYKKAAKDNKFRDAISIAIVRYADQNYKSGEFGAIFDEITDTMDALTQKTKRVDFKIQQSSFVEKIRKVKNGRYSELVSTQTKTNDLLKKHLQVKELLKDIDYKKLLDLTFYDEDFLASWSISNVVVDGIPETWAPSGMSILPSTIRNGIIGNISYTLIVNDGINTVETTRRTTTLNWNILFPVGSPFHI